MVNIICRTSQNPKEFDRCLKSIQEQDYKHINLIVIADDKGSDAYVRQHNITPYYVDREIIRKRYENYKLKPGHRYLPHNLYFNMIESELMPGYILHLDSSDVLSSPTIISEIMDYVEEDKLLLFFVEIEGILIPRNPAAIPRLNDLSGSGFIFHTKYWHSKLWNYMSGSDYFCAKQLFDRIKDRHFVDKTVVVAPRVGFGDRRDIV